MSVLCLAGVALSPTLFAANPSGNLRIELISGYNFVVRSNIESQPGTSPESAYLGAKYCNDGATPLTNVFAHIGNYNGGTNSTPGVYPLSNPADHPALTGPLTGGSFALTHEGGMIGTADATRFIGTIEPGECVTVYWLVSYPHVDVNGNAVHGPSVKPNDDLALKFDVWGSAYDQGTLYTADESREVRLRSMLQAMANKISPNTANKVPQEYLDLLQVYAPTWTNVVNDGSPGTSFLTEGYWYDLGNINQGFDNDGDLVPDYNAWLQPIGDPSIFDPSCFRLVSTRTLLVIKRTGGQPDLVIIAEDQLYFTGLPPDNSGGIGLVIYEFVPLRSDCGSTLTPYNAVASGKENEKYNGDYGATLGGGMQSTPSSVTINKEVDLPIAGPGSNLTYAITFTNTGIVAVGLPDMGVPLVVGDAVPQGSTYVAGSAATGNVLPAGVAEYAIFYSTNNGVSWSQTEPSTASDVTDIQWWLSDPLQTNTSGAVTFQVTVNDPAPPLVFNVAGLSFGNTAPFAEDDAVTLITGPYLISGTVFGDIGTGGGSFGNGILDGAEPGITNVLVSLYFDSNGNGILDNDDVPYSTTNSATLGGYTFSNLPNGNYIVVVDQLDPDLPLGYSPTSPTRIPVTLSGSNSTGNNFGFAPGLTLTKTGPALVDKGGQAIYTLGVSNNLPPGGSQSVMYTVWATNENPSLEGGNQNAQFLSKTNAYRPSVPDGIYAEAPLSTGNDRRIGLWGYTLTPQSSSITNVKLLIPFTVSGTFGASDTLTLHIRTNGLEATAAVWTTSYLFTALSGPGVITNDVTHALAWNWSRFNPANSNLFVQVVTTRSGGGTRTFFLDQAGFLVTSDEPTDVLDPVPVYDYYDTNVLQFVSATPNVTLSDGGGPPPNTGRLYWSNVGPLAPNQATNISVTFNVIGPPGNLGGLTTNTAVITNAFFSTGVPANQGFAQVETEIPGAASIGDTIFWDANRNGTEDGGEAGIPGVLVELYSNATLIASQYTDANGNYLFDNLPPGTYTVLVVQDDGNPNYPLLGAELTADPDADGVPCWSPFAVGCDNQTVVTLIAGQTFNGADWGYDPPGGTIGGLLWVDFNDNGMWNPGEDGLSFIPVELWSNGTLVATTLTDADGYYLFYGLPDGNYHVQVVTNDVDFPFPPGLTQTYDRDGVIDNVATNILLSGGSVVSVDGIPCTSCDLSNNFGYRYTGNNSLSGTVGLDDPTLDGVLNGTNTSGVATNEVAFSGVTVYAYLWHDLDDNGLVNPGETILVATTLTGANGDYAFANLPDGFDTNPYYLVSLSAPMTWLSLTTDTNSTPNPSFLVVNTQNLQGHTVSAYQAVEINPTIMNVDFAFETLREFDFGDLPNSYGTLLTGGARHVVRETPDLYLGADVSVEPNGQPSVNADADDLDDGVFVAGIWQHGTDGGIVRVEVGAGSGWLVGFVDFNKSGAFDNANELIISSAVSSTGGVSNDGVYQIEFAVPAGTLSTTNTTYLYARFRLFPSQPLFPVLAYQGEASNGEVEDYRWAFNAISGTVYWDADADTLFSGGDQPQAGVVVRLYDANSNEVASTVTALDGSYRFYGLPNGDYRIEMEEPVGANAILDVDGAGNGNDVIEVSLNNNSVNNQNFLLDDQPTVADISGTVWEDDGFYVAGNGLFDANDMPVPGVLISLYRDINGDGTIVPTEFIASVVTDINGYYLFENLPDGDFIVLMSTPGGADSIDDADGDANGTDLIQVTLLNGIDAEDQDFLVDGSTAIASLSGLVWFDASRNGIRENNETNRFSNVPVDLLDAGSNVVATTMTAGDGTYAFTNVAPGSYTVRFDLAALDEYTITTPFAGIDPTRNSDGTHTNGVFAFTQPILLLASQDEEHIDLGLMFPAPTLAAIADVWGEWNGRAEVVWETSSEFGTAAFRVYRVDAETGAETPLQDDWIPSALVTGGEPIYRAIDPVMLEGSQGLYRLEELESHGDLRDLGTHEVHFTAPRIQAKLMRTASATPSIALMTSAVTGPDTSDCLKVPVRKDGVYAVALESIASRMDQPISFVRQWAAQGELGLRTAGQAVPLLYDVDGDRIIFFGRATTDWYAQDNVYWIRREPGRTMERRAPGAGDGQTVFPVTVRIEENVFPKSYWEQRPDDWYYWNFIISRADAQGGEQYPVTLKGYAGGDVTMRVQLLGYAGAQHHALFDFNGVLAGTLNFTDKNAAVAEFTIPESLVNGENNTLRIRGHLPAGQPVGYFVTDWMEADYQRTLSPDSAAILFASGEANAVSAEAFDAPLALIVTDPNAPLWVADEGHALPGKTWAAGEGDRVALIDRAAIPMLEPAAGVCDAWFMARNNRKDYIIITTRDLESAALELAAYRESQGLRVGVALFDEICDLFADGLRTPVAIQSFLRYAREQWSSAPWLVLLAGSGHNDYIHGAQQEINHLPPFLAESHNGLFAADGLLADLNADGRPDLAIGRLPARHATELLTMIDKIRAYELSHGEEWHRTVVLTADRNDASGNNFVASSAQLGAAADGAELVTIDLNQLSRTAARSALFSRFSTGAGFIHYTGHGTIRDWNGNTILRHADVPNLNSERLPVVIALTCLSGRFEDFWTRESLSEQLVRRTGGGAVAAWSAAGMSYNQPATQLGEAFYRAVFQQEVGTLGLAILRAQKEMADDPLLGSTFAMYNLLGDPATKLGAVQQGNGRVGNQFAQWRWETFRPDELANPGVSGPGSDGLGTGRNNFLMYALNGAGLVPGLAGNNDDPAARGPVSQSADTGSRATISWKQLEQSEDVTYRVSVSTDLKAWQVDPPGFEIISRAVDGDGIMERITATIPFETDRLYLKLDVIEK